VLNVRYFKAFVYFLNEKIIITGTSRGIGYELALKFAMLDKVLAISRKHLGF
jgi:short-subunit dehydrogenase